VDKARADGVELVGPDGMLTGLTKSVVETALEEEMSDHLGYDRHEPAGRNGGNSRNGTRSKTVLTEIGPVEIEVPRDRDGSFEPQIVRKRQRRLDGIDEIVLSLTARGLTTGEVAAHFAEVYGARVSKDTISKITDKVIEEMTEWQNRPLDRVYPVLFIDAIVVKVRDGQVTNRPFYVVIGVSVNGERDIGGIWAGDGSEGATFWLAVRTDLNNRGVEDVCMVVCDGLKGLPDSITTTWLLAQVQACILYLIRNTFRYASRKDWEVIARDLKPVYTAANEQAAQARFDEFAEVWADRYPAIIRLWRQAWTEFAPFLDHDVEVRRLICSTNAIESINARYRRAVRARGHTPVLPLQGDQGVDQVGLGQLGGGHRGLAAGVVGGRRDRDTVLGQHGADRLDVEPVPVAGDVVDDHLSRRSSSAWAKNAALVLRISFARSSSATRFLSVRTSSGSLTRTDGARLPSARSASSTQFRSVAGFRSNSDPTCRRVPSLDSPDSASRSRYIRTARSRNSWSYLLGADRLQSPLLDQHPPRDPGRFDVGLSASGLLE
jgi:putative transposase